MELDNANLETRNVIRRSPKGYKNEARIQHKLLKQWLTGLTRKNMKGRCVVQQGDVSLLTLKEEKYDLATEFETYYFWPELEKCFEQVANVLKTGGYFLIVNESDGKDASGHKIDKYLDKKVSSE